MSLNHDLETFLEQRFGERIAIDPELQGLERIDTIVKHRAIRRYSDKAVDPELVRLICACALSAPLAAARRSSGRRTRDRPPRRRWVATCVWPA